MIRKLGPLPFNLYYVKGKNLVLTDFLSRIKSDDSDPNEVLPISFVDMQMAEQPPDYHLRIRTRSGAKCEGATVPPIHGFDKTLDPYKKPEHQPSQPAATPLAVPTCPVPTPQHGPVACKPTPAMMASRKLVGRSIKMLNKPRAPAKSLPPPPTAPLIPQFYPLNPNTPVPQFQNPPTAPPATVPIAMPQPVQDLLPYPHPHDQPLQLLVDPPHPQS